MVGVVDDDSWTTFNERVHVGALLRRARLAKGWSQERLAHAAGISVQAYGAIERQAVVAPGKWAMHRIGTIIQILEQLDLELVVRERVITTDRAGLHPA